MVMRGMPERVVWYLDDILVLSTSLEQHQADLKLVFYKVYQSMVL